MLCASFLGIFAASGVLCLRVDAFSPRPSFPRTSVAAATTRRGVLPSSAASSSPATDPPLPLNPLLDRIKPSKTVEVFSLVKQMEAEGDAVTSLCVGEPDFAPPPGVLDAAAAALQAGRTRYTAVTGTLELRTAIADDLRARKGVAYDPASEIVVGNGAKQVRHRPVRSNLCSSAPDAARVKRRLLGAVPSASTRACWRRAGRGTR